MAASKEELLLELKKITDNNFDIKDYFKPLFATFLINKNKLHNNDKVYFVDELIHEEHLEKQLRKKYPKKDYVLLFYAHKPHSPAVSPHFPKEPRAHVSLLLCKVKENKIGQILNIDGYHFLSYIDILGERKGASPNPLIKQRLVLQAYISETATKKVSIQRPSWENMNSLLYAMTYAGRVLELFNEQPDVMRNLFPEQENAKISQESLFLLEEEILQGLVGKYLKKAGATYINDPLLTQSLHNEIRTNLAQGYKNKFESFEEIEQAVAIIDTSNPLSTPMVNPNTQDKTQNHSSNYSFMLNTGIIFSGTLSLTALVVAGLAITISIGISPIEIATIASAGVLSGLICYGLFNEKNKNSGKQVTNTPERNESLRSM